MSYKPKYKPGDLIKAKVTIGFLGYKVIEPNNKLVVIDVWSRFRGTLYYKCLHSGKFVVEICKFLDVCTELM